MSTKTCTRCGEAKPATTEFFAPYRPRGAGLRARRCSLTVGTCRVCEGKYTRAHYEKNKVSVLADEKKKYQADPCRKRVAARAYRKKNPKKAALAQWRSHLKKKYGISIDDYDALYVRQEGCCAICRGVPAQGRLHIDHDHTTGQVRGLLCRSCNMGLGHFGGEDAAVLQRAAMYLRSHQQAPTEKLAAVIPLHRK